MAVIIRTSIWIRVDDFTRFGAAQKHGDGLGEHDQSAGCQRYPNELKTVEYGTQVTPGMWDTILRRRRRVANDARVHLRR